MKKHLTKYIVSNSLPSRLMTRPLVRFGIAILSGCIMALITIFIMKSFIDDYDETAEGATFRIFNLNTVSLEDGHYKAVPYSEYSGKGSKDTDSQSPKNTSKTNMKSKELQKILRKKEEIISILEEGS